SAHAPAPARAPATNETTTATSACPRGWSPHRRTDHRPFGGCVRSRWSFPAVATAGATVGRTALVDRTALARRDRGRPPVGPGRLTGIAARRVARAPQPPVDAHHQV